MQQPQRNGPPAPAVQPPNQGYGGYAYWPQPNQPPTSTTPVAAPNVAPNSAPYPYAPNPASYPATYAPANYPPPSGPAAPAAYPGSYVPPPAAYPPAQPAYQSYAPPAALPPAANTKVSSQIPSNVNPNEQTSVWMAEVENWMEESYLFNLFAATHPVVNVKVIKNTQKSASGQHAYAFVYFQNAYIAQQVIESYNNRPIPGTNKIFKLNWGAPKGQVAPGSIKANDAQGIFVGDLAPEVTESYLQSVFQYYYPSVYSARIIHDTSTGQQRCFAFVHFNNEQERLRAMSEMQGFNMAGRGLKIGPITKKTDTKAAVPQQPQYQPQNPEAVPPAPDNTISTVFIGNLDPLVTQEMIRQTFSPFGEIVGIKIPMGKGCAFVDFASHESASRAIAQKITMGRNEVRLSWGKPGKGPRANGPEQGQGGFQQQSQQQQYQAPYDPTQPQVPPQQFQQQPQQQQQQFQQQQQQFPNQQQQQQQYVPQQPQQFAPQQDQFAQPQDQFVPPQQQQQQPQQQFQSQQQDDQNFAQQQFANQPFVKAENVTQGVVEEDDDDDEEGEEPTPPVKKRKAASGASAKRKKAKK